MQSANRRELKIVHKTKNSNTHNPSKFYLDSNSKIKTKQITIILLILRMEKNAYVNAASSNFQIKQKLQQKIRFKGLLIKPGNNSY